MMRLKRWMCIGMTLVMIVTAAGCGAATGAATFGDQAGEEMTSEAAAETAAQENAEQETAAKETATEETAAAGNTAAGEISPEDISVTWEDSRVYADLTLGRYTTITTYGVKGYEDVPFIKATDYLGILYEGRERISMEDGSLKISVNETESVIDPAADTIRIENPAKLRSAGEVDGAIVDNSEFNVITVSAKNKSAQTEAVPLVISLADYHMPVIAFEGDILMPFLALQNTFGGVTMSNVFAYNGKDYFNAYSATNFASDGSHAGAKDSPYMKAIYSGPFSKKETTTQAYADYGYYSICLLLDLTFGHKEEKNITTFDEYFTRMNAKKAMCSTKPSAAVTAEVMLFNYLFDSGHDSMVSMDTVFGTIEKADASEVGEIADEIKESSEGRELFEEEKDAAESEEDQSLDVILGALIEKGLKVPEVAPLMIWSLYFGSTKPADYGNERLDYAGDTAVIYFNAFKDDTGTRKPSYYLDPIREEDKAASSFAFFHECFEDIGRHDEVKNVVINLSDNGGGSAAALVAVLGFLSGDGEVKITDQDLVAGNYREECYHVDTNLDGVADDEDGYGGQYEFYIMCSPSSYSCGNALPYYAQQNGLAKIIGTQPGGGDCVVGAFIDAYGRCAAYSGMLKLGKDDGNGFVSDEKATELDLNMLTSILNVNSVPWYDPEGIADAVHQYQSGAAEIDYDDRSDGEIISDFLMGLLESIAQSAESDGESSN